MDITLSENHWKEILPDHFRYVADLCELQTEPDRGLDNLIFRCIAKGLFTPETSMYWQSTLTSFGKEPRFFTLSQDAAEVLIPESRHTELIIQDRHTRRWKRTLRGGFGIRSESRGQTLPLATCAAALRAHAEEMTEKSVELPKILGGSG